MENLMNFLGGEEFS